MRSRRGRLSQDMAQPFLVGEYHLRVSRAQICPLVNQFKTRRPEHIDSLHGPYCTSVSEVERSVLRSHRFRRDAVQNGLVEFENGGVPDGIIPV